MLFAILYSQNKIIATEIHGASRVFYVTRAFCCLQHRFRSVWCVFLYDMFCSVRHVRSVLCSTCSVRNPSVIPRQGTTGDKRECLCLTWEWMVTLLKMCYFDANSYIFFLCINHIYIIIPVLFLYEINLKIHHWLMFNLFKEDSPARA